MIIAVIPAKEESRRLPNKNLLEINGKSLIEYAVEFAKNSEKIDRIYVSTDSEKIALQARQLGADIVMRDKSLGGETPLIEVYRHAWKQINDASITHIVGIQPDNPDRKIDLDKAIDYAFTKNIDNLFTVDNLGRHNGSCKVLSLKALRVDPFVYSSTILDNCTNIHTPFDFGMACKNMSEYSDTITIGSRRIGEKEPAFIIAEAACNHMCRMDLAKEMIDRANEAGVDAVKFQTYKAEKLVTRDAVAFWGNEKISQLEYYRKLDNFGRKEYEELFKYAYEKGIIPFSSPFDEESAGMLAELDMPVYKIASCDIPNLLLLKKIAGFGKPIILSTGASTPKEIDKAIETIFNEGNYQLMLLACTLSYPTKYPDANLLRIKTLKERYTGMIVGLSDHTEPDSNMIIPSVAVAAGAKIIEKHYTLDRSMTGSGHFFASTAGNFKKMVDNIRLTEAVLGDGSLGVADSEKKAWSSARRSIVAEQFIKKGDVITEEMLGMKRPAEGLPGNMIDKVIGKKAKVDISPDKYLTMEMLEC